MMPPLTMMMMLVAGLCIASPAEPTAPEKPPETPPEKTPNWWDNSFCLESNARLELGYFGGMHASWGKPHMVNAVSLNQTHAVVTVERVSFNAGGGVNHIVDVVTIGANEYKRSGMDVGECVWIWFSTSGDWKGYIRGGLR